MKRDALRKWTVWGITVCVSLILAVPDGWAQSTKSATAKVPDSKPAAAASKTDAKPKATLPKATDPAKAGTGKSTPGKKSSKGKGKTSAPVKKEAAPTPELPWSLRDHFTISAGKAALQYAVLNAEWALEVEGMGTLIKGVDFRINLADGTIIDATKLGEGESIREAAVTNDVGKSKAYIIKFPPKDGLTIQHRMEVYSDRPYILIHVTIGNTSQKPVEIAKISPVVIRPGQMASLGADAEVVARKIQFVGVSPVFDKAGPASLMAFRVPSKEFQLSLGSLPQAIPSVTAEFTPAGDSWAGEVACSYKPVIRLDPGQKIDASTWLTIAVPDTKTLDTYYSWITSMAPHTKTDAEKPLSWVTVENGQNEEDLMATLSAWSPAKVGAALVPVTWESKPGFLECGLPGFSKDMGKLVKRIHHEGAKAGLTLDPLRIAGGQAEWSTKTPDGQQWLNLSVQGAKQFCVERIKKLAGDEYDFYVVAASAVPDDVLKGFNMTRTMAQTLALEAVAEANGGKPVYPASVSTALKAEEAAWSEAVAATGHMAYYGISIAPVRFAATDVSSVDDNVLKAMALFTGPIEIVGKPQADVAKKLSSVFSPESVRGIPGETTSTTPAPEKKEEATPDKKVKTEKPPKATKAEKAEAPVTSETPDKANEPKKKWWKKF